METSVGRKPGSYSSRFLRAFPNKKILLFFFSEIKPPNILHVSLKLGPEQNGLNISQQHQRNAPRHFGPSGCEGDYKETKQAQHYWIQQYWTLLNWNVGSVYLNNGPHYTFRVLFISWTGKWYTLSSAKLFCALFEVHVLRSKRYPFFSSVREELNIKILRKFCNSTADLEGARAFFSSKTFC